MPRTAKPKISSSAEPKTIAAPQVAALPAAEPVAALADAGEKPALAAAQPAPQLQSSDEKSLPAESAPSTNFTASPSASPERITTANRQHSRQAPPPVPVRSRSGNGFGNRQNRHANNGYNNSYSNRSGNQGYAGGQTYGPDETVPSNMVAGTVTGVLDTSKDGHGVLRLELSGEHDKDTYISAALIRRHNLRPGDVITGPVRNPKENERYWGLLKVEEINGKPTAEAMKLDRPRFKSLTPVYPDEKISLEIGEEPLSLRIIDLVAPIGKGQRSLIVSPPKAGKTTLLKDIAAGVATNHPEIHIMAVLVGERPEEVTDIRRHIARITNNDGEVAASNFDESAEDQCRVAEVALEKAKRMVEMGKDVLILLDSITRLARAYNLAIPTSGRTLSGGFDPAALFPPKHFFGAARNFEVPGSLTIVGTALVETGSRMDDLIYEEFKGTGNQEVHLDRRLAERRIYPAIDVQRSGTRRDDLLVDSMTYQSVMTLQRMLDTLDKEERTSVMVSRLRRTKTNKEFLATLKVG